METNTFASQLRILADAVENIGITAGYISGSQIGIWTYSQKEYTAMVRKVLRSPYTTKGEKSANNYSSTTTFRLTADESLTIVIQTSRENVCRKIQTGTSIVQKPDPNAQVPMIDVEEPVYEWSCEPILGGNEDGNVSDGT